MKNFILFLFMIHFIISCKQETPEDGMARLRMPPGEQISIVTKNQLTGEENKLTLKNTDGGILVYGIEHDNGDEAIPSYKDLVGSLIGAKSKNNGQKTKYPSIKLKEGFIQIKHWDQPQRYQSRLQYQWQNPSHTELRALIKREKIQEIIKDKNELEAFIALNNWTRSQWQPGSPKVYPPWNANTILHMIRSGNTGGFCGQYTQVLAQTLTALGYNCRYLWLNAHFAMEVYSNSLDKWIVLDPFYHCVFKHDNKLLSAHEIYDLLKNKLNSQIYVENTLEFSEITGDQKNKVLSAYKNFVIDLKMNHLEENKSGLSYVNNYWKHSAMLAEEENMKFDFTSIPPLLTPWPQDLYAGQNQVGIKILNINDKFISIGLETNTPFHKHFEIATQQSTSYQKSTDKVNIPFEPGINNFTLLSINSMGIAGPPAKLSFNYQKYRP